MHDSSWFIAAMVNLDQTLRAHAGLPLSLAPDRKQATAFQDIVPPLLHRCCPASAVLKAVEQGLRKIVLAQIENFPENIFWDMDFLTAFLCKIPNPSQIEAITHLIADLQYRFGIQSAIHFQYAHDFTYGYDWARWVAKDPARRADTSPFSIEFLQYLQSRADELLALIAANDRKYHPLADARPRNPFAFNRTPTAEKKLHKILAARGLVPVHAWHPEGPCIWNRDYTREREVISREIEHQNPS